MRAMKALWTDQEGVMSLETTLLVVLVALAALAAWHHLGGTLAGRVASASRHLAQPVEAASLVGSAR